MGKREYPLRMVAWELTRNCNLSCVHCRASADKGPHTGELSTEECRTIIDNILTFSSPTVILTGGEPLLRPDIFEIIEYGREKGLRLVIAVNGTLVTQEVARRMKDSGIQRVSLSIDGKDPLGHDEFRKVAGAFDAVIGASEIFRRINLPFQVNTTVTSLNVQDIDGVYSLTKSLGAVAWHIFLLVPVGRGKGLKGKELSAKHYEDVLHHLRDIEKRNELEIKVTCAPHYYRIVVEDGDKPKSAGCLAGKSFMFISHTGIAQPCGYLELPSGDVRKDGLRHVWENSAVFAELRDLASYRGKCGSCRYLRICGGCRARAFEATGNYRDPEPLCSYEP
ncbi:MAG: radical SAM protein [Syntrophorhabdaceae bacterium]